MIEKKKEVKVRINIKKEEIIQEIVVVLKADQFLYLLIQNIIQGFLLGELMLK